MSELITHVPSAAELQAQQATAPALVDGQIAGGPAAANTTYDQTALPQQADVQSFRYPAEEQQEELDGYLHNIAVSQALPADRKQAMAEIISTGTLNGQEAYLAEGTRNQYDEAMTRYYLANLMATAPETATTLIEQGVAGFHATRSVALAGILEHGGLLPTTTLREKGAPIASGEHMYQSAKGQTSTSFASLGHTKRTVEQFGGTTGVTRRTNEEAIADAVHEAAKLRELQGPENSEKFNQKLEVFAADSDKIAAELEQHPHTLFATLMRNEFPVALGVNKDFVRDAEATRTSSSLLFGQSDQGEFRPASESIPMSALGVIAVPREVVNSVQALLARPEFNYTDTKVVALEDLMVSPFAHKPDIMD